MPDKTYCYSSDEEHYYGSESTREAVLAEYIDDEDPGDTVYTGVIVPVPIERLLPAAFHIIERMQEDSFDEVGEEASDGWLEGLSLEAEADLEQRVRAAIIAWMDQWHQHPQFFWVREIQEHVVPERAESAS